MLSNVNNLSLKSVLQIPMVKQLIFILGVAGGVAIGIVLYMSIQEPIYRPLDYQVTPQNMSAIVDTLEKSGIKYKMNDQDGVIMIPAKDIQLARVKLSAAGVAKDDGFNFSFLNDQNSIGNSQFMENARYIRELENDLSKTISAIEGVSSAKVHIAIPQSNVFADENGKPTASVVLSMGAGLSSDKEKIRAIVQIVSGSVPGLDPRNVAITDQYGHYLSNAMDQDSMYNAEQLSYQNNIQNYYEKRIESMIVPLVGAGKVSVRVYADIDYTQQEESKEQYNPDEKVIRSEQSVSEQSGSGGASGPAGSLSNTPPTTDAEKNANGGGGGTQGRNESIKNYELGKSVTYKKQNFAKVASLSVAVVVDNDTQVDPKTGKITSKPLDKDKITKLTDLVKATIGYVESRGDKVTIINSSFNVEKTPEVLVEQRPWNQPWFWDAIKKIVGMIVGFLFLYILYRRMSSYLKSTARPQPVVISLEDQENSYLITPEMQELKVKQMNRLKELASQDPNKVASVLKNWVGK
jgi:flagellar M-ring protein FliF